MDALLRTIRRWRLLTIRKFLYLPHILSTREKRFWALLVVVTLVGGTGLLVRLWHTITIPVPAVGGSYREGMLGVPSIINPLYATADAERDLARLIYAGLFTYSGDGTLIPDMAEKFDISGDGKIYTVTLKKGILWHDGREVRADDVIFTVRTIQNPLYRSVLRANWQGVTAEELDDWTIRFTLPAPYAPFIENLTVGILPKHLWESVRPEQAPLHTLNLKPIGSGPYRFEAFGQEQDGTITWYQVSRNPRYHTVGPYLTDITFYFFPREENLVTAWKKGDIDGFGPVPHAELSNIDPDKSTLITLKMPRVFGLFFNQAKTPSLRERNVREAIARAIDRSTLVTDQLLASAIPLTAPLPFTHGKEQEFTFDTERAKTLLDEAGWNKLNADGIRIKVTREKNKAATSTLAFTLVTSDWPDLLHTAEKLQSMLRAVGIGITIQQKSFTDLEASIIRPRNFELLLFGQVYGYEMDPFTFWHSTQIKDPGLNIALYANKTADKILEDARRIQDRDARAKKYEEFVTTFAEEIPSVFLYSQLYHYVVPVDLGGITLSTVSLPSDRFNEINQWYLKTRRQLK